MQSIRGEGLLSRTQQVSPGSRNLVREPWTWTRLVLCARRHVGAYGVSRVSAGPLLDAQHREAQHAEQEQEPRPSVSGRVPALIRATPAMLQDAVTMFRTQPWEFDYWVEESMVTGCIPEELQGTYFRNGPGLQIGHARYQRHYLDGDGCMLSLAFPGGGKMPRFSNKYVRTKGFVAEQEAGRPLYRNAFTRGSADGSGLFNPLDLSFKNVANTGVLYWAERLWALWEVGRPYELDPQTLDTLGEDSMGGQIGQRMAGHYRVVREQDGQLRCVCFGTQVSISGTDVEFYEFDVAGQLVVKSKQSLQGFEIMPIHDMLVTDHWYIVLLGPVKFDVWRLLSDYPAAKCSLAELMEFDASLPSKIILFPRPGKFGKDGVPKSGSNTSSGHEGDTGSSPSQQAMHLRDSDSGTDKRDRESISSEGYVSCCNEAGGAASSGDGGSGDSSGSNRPVAPGSPPAAPPAQVPKRAGGDATASTSAAGAPQRSRGLGAGASEGAPKAPGKRLESLDLPPPVVVQGPSFFSFHHVNAYEVPGGNQIIMDTIGWQDLKVDVTQHNVTEDYFSSGCRSHLHRLCIDVRSARTLSCTRLLRRTLEFPTMNGAATAQPYRHAYFASDAVDDEVAWAPAQVLLKVTLPAHEGHPLTASGGRERDSSSRSGVVGAKGSQGAAGLVSGKLDSTATGVVTSEWAPGERCFMQEPMFVPRVSGKAEDDGWIIVAVHNAASLRGEIAILDAQRIQNGPVATIRLPHALPYGLHGAWTPKYLGPDPQDPTVPRWREPNRIREL